MSKPTQMDPQVPGFAGVGFLFFKGKEGKAMTEVRVDQRVQLMHDIPELELHSGEVGLVCSTWFTPATIYEVEFRRKILGCPIRAMLMPSQITGEPNVY